MHVIRAHMSGVWFADILGPGEFPGMVRIRGRRAHYWRGAIDCSSLADSGPRPESRITAEVERTIHLSDIIEFGPMTDAAVAALNMVPVS